MTWIRTALVFAAAVVAVAGVATVLVAQTTDESRLYELRRTLIDRIEEAFTHGDAHVLEVMEAAERRERRFRRFREALANVPPSEFADALRAEAEREVNEIIKANPSRQLPTTDGLVGVESNFAGGGLLDTLMPCMSIMTDGTAACYGDPNDYSGSGYRPCMNRADQAGPAREARRGGCEWQFSVCRDQVTERYLDCTDRFLQAWFSCPGVC